MSTELLEKAQGVIRGASKRGAQGARASAYRVRESSLEWRDGKLERLQESTQLGLGVTLFVDGRYSAHSTSDLRPAALEAFLDECVAMTRVLSTDEHRKLPDPARYQGRFAGELGILDEAGVAAAGPDHRKRVVQALEAATRSGPGAEQIVSVTSGWSDTSGESVLVCSNGMEGGRRSSSFSLWAECAVKDAGGRKPEGWWYAAGRVRDKLQPAEEIGREALRRALAQVGARPEKSGEYPCVVEAAVAGRLFSDLLGPLSGWAIQQKRSFLADKLDQVVAAPCLTLADDPLLPAGLASRAYDDEGMSTARRPVFEQGALRTFFLDTYYASKLGRVPTTGGTSNLVFAPGPRDLAGLLQAMGTGLLITGFSGGNSNSATGDFSLGVKGMWIDGGKPVRPVAEMNLSGNHLELWKRLVELGNDPDPSSSMRIPSLRFDPVQFSGT
jgi:PmbA protein